MGFFRSCWGGGSRWGGHYSWGSKWSWRHKHHCEEEEDEIDTIPGGDPVTEPEVEEEETCEVSCHDYHCSSLFSEDCCEEEEEEEEEEYSC